MRTMSWHSRLLPLTMAVIAALFAEKAAGLAREVTATAMPAPMQSSVTTAPGTTGGASPAALPPPSPGTSAASATPAASTAELQLLQELRKRRQALDDREREINRRDDILQATQVKLQARLDELTALQARLEQIETVRQKRNSANWTGLVKTYEDMKPRDAATIFNVLDLHVLLEVLDRMDERKAAAVLAGMLPERARVATQMLAQKRTQQDGAAPSVSAAGYGKAD